MAMALEISSKNISSLSLPSLVHTPSDTDTDTDTDPNTDSDSDIDLDLLEEVELDITDYDRDMPARPASRLGFNRALIQGQRHMQDLKASDSEKTSHLHSAVTLRWTTGLFQKTSQAVAKPVSSSETQNDDISLSPSSSSSVGEGDSDSSGSNWSTSDDENTSSDVPNTPVLRFPPPPHGSRPMPQSMPQTCRPVPFPIIRSSGSSPEFPPEHTSNPTPSPPPLFATITQGRPKFSCLPSPFSPVYPAPPPLSPFSAQNEPHTAQIHHPHPNPLRHHYANRGHSRNALLHLKCFWSARYDEWIDYEYVCAESSDACTKMDIFSDDSAYGGLAILSGAHFRPQPPSRSPPVPPSRSSANKTSLSPPPPMPTPLTIHPRTGDIAALRDPYCMHIDVCFAGLPLWTLGKTLWMFEVHRLDVAKVGEGENKVENREADAEAGQDLDIEMTRSSSVGFSESSDVTLVDDPMAKPVRSFSPSVLEIDKAAGKECITDVDIDADADMSMMQDDAALFEKYLLEDAKVTQVPAPAPSATSLSPKAPDAHTPAHRACVVPWERTWYARWERLVELVRLDQARGQGVVPGAAPVKDRGRRMFYLEDDDEDDDDDGRMDVDDDGEEDDYGVLVANPVYPPSRVFDTGSRD